MNRNCESGAARDKTYPIHYSSIKDLDSDIRKCKKCILGCERKNAVPGEGKCSKRIIFIGEAPGRIEDETGRPFVGRAGQILGDVLENAGLSRNDAFITSILKCRPPDNRDPTPEEKDACSHWLEEQMNILSPRVIAPLGRHGLSFISKRYDMQFGSITSEHGKTHAFKETWGDVTVIPLFHPAALIYRRHLLPEAQEDMITLANLV